MRARAAVCLLALVAGVATAGPASAADTARISGTLTSPGGDPLGGVCVEAFGDSGYVTTATSSDGGYVLDELAADEWTVGFNACVEPLPGYAAEWFDDATVLDDADQIALAEGEARTDVDAVLAETGSFSGTVVDEETGDGLEGVCVQAFGTPSGEIGEATTDADGAYVVEELPEGDYSVFFQDCADPLLHVSEYYDDVPAVLGEPASEPVLVAVAGGQDNGGVDAALTEGGAVTGTVTGLHTGAELALVCVALFSVDAADDDPPVSGAFTGLAASETAIGPGDFTVPGVPAGEYLLAFNAPICEDDGYATSWFDEKPTREDATVITVVQGEVAEGVDAMVVPTPSTSFACSFEVFPPSEPRFTDVPEGNVHRPAIECLADSEVVRGRPDGGYGPADLVTRAQLASFVARTLTASGYELPTDPDDAFTDDDGDVHEPAIDQLAALGVVSGKGDGRYAPAETVNRAQMATFLLNAYEVATGLELQAPEDRFSDDEGSIHEASIDKVATAGIAAGGAGGDYVPSGLVRRDQMATFLARTIDRVSRDNVADGFEEGSAGGLRSSSLRAAYAGWQTGHQ